MTEGDIGALVGYGLAAFALGWGFGYLHRAFHRFMEMI